MKRNYYKQKHLSRMSTDSQIVLQDDINDLITNQIIRLGLESKEHQQLMREIIAFRWLHQRDLLLWDCSHCPLNAVPPNETLPYHLLLVPLDCSHNPIIHYGSSLGN